MEHLHTIEPAMVFVGGLVAVAILATRLSARLGVPALILFLATGMLAGSDGPGGVWFDDPRLTWSVGILALAILLFAGGLETEVKQVRPVLGPGLVLATVGVGVSTGATAAFDHLVLGRPWAEGLLLGAIVSSTDAAAVFGVLRASGLRLRGRIQPLVEMESGSNDPMAIFLTLAATGFLAGDEIGVGSVAVGFVLQMGVGVLFGLAGAWAIPRAVDRLSVAQEGLYPVFTLALALALFGLTALAGGSGFLAIYVAGIGVASAPLVHRRAILRFHDAIAWLAQIGMFVLLGLLVFPSHLVEVAGEGLLLGLFLLFVARPLAVVASLTPFGVPWREQAMVAWVGLRGAVPIVLAIWPRVLGVPGAETVFDLVFFVVVLSVLAQGGTLPFVARRLGVVEPAPAPGGPDLLAGDVHGADVLTAEVGAALADRRILDLGLPPGALVVSVERDGMVIVPQGRTVLRGGDVLRVVVQEGQAPEVRARLG